MTQIYSQLSQDGIIRKIVSHFHHCLTSIARKACKDGNPASSSFDYGGPLTEMALLGMIAIRLKDQRLKWDSKKLKFTNNQEANRLLHKEYRKGWSL